MKVKRLMIRLLAFALCVPLCACQSAPSEESASSDQITDLPTETAYKKKAPDYSAMLKQHLGIEPEPSSFEELRTLAQSRKDDSKFYWEDEEGLYITLYFRNTRLSVGRYEKAQELIEHFFPENTELYWVKHDNGHLILTAIYHNGPEGMTDWVYFRVAVDTSGKYIVLADDRDVPDTDLDVFFDTSIVSVETFKFHYLMSDSTIDDELIEAYIRENSICKFDLFNENHLEKLKDIISKGQYYKLGYAIRDRLKRDYNEEENGEKYIKDAELFYFEFEFPVPGSDEPMVENIVFDLKHSKVYLNANVKNYREAELCVDLSDEVLKSLKEDLIKNVGPSHGNKYHNLEYSYKVYAVNPEGDYVKYSVYARNTVNALFDTYWQELYKMCFGKEHKLNTDGFDPELNKKRGLSY